MTPPCAVGAVEPGEQITTVDVVVLDIVAVVSPAISGDDAEVLMVPVLPQLMMWLPSIVDSKPDPAITADPRVTFQRRLSRMM